MGASNPLNRESNDWGNEANEQTQCAKTEKDTGPFAWWKADFKYGRLWKVAYVAILPGNDWRAQNIADS